MSVLQRLSLSSSSCSAVLLALIGLTSTACESDSGDCPTNFEDIEGLCVQLPIPELGVYEGDLTIETPEDAEEFCLDYNAVLGDLRLAPTLTSASELDCLQQVAGDLILEELDGMDELSLPSLYWVGGHLSIQANTPRLTKMNLDALRAVGDGITVHVNDLEELSMARLEQLEGHLSVYSNLFLRSLDLPLLQSVGNDENIAVLYVRLNHALEELYLPALETVTGVLKVSSNLTMTALEMPSLLETGRGLYISYCEVLESYELPIEEVGGFLFVANSFVSSVAFPELRTVDEDFNVIFNQNLSEASFPKLESIGSNLIIEANPELSEAQIDEILAGVEIGGEVRIVNNGPS